MTITFGESKLDLEYITINQYRKLLENPNMDDVELISLLTTLPLEELRDVKVSELQFVSSYLKTWVSQLQKSPLTYTIKYKGQMLGLLDATEMTYGEFSDLHILTSSDNVEYEKVCSILYRPVISGKGEDRKIEKYDYDKCMERSKDMGDFPINNYISALFFLTKYNQILLEDSPLYLEKKRRDELKNQTKEQETRE